jgi:hypothetical protein
MSADPLPFREKIVLVTGSGRGIGRAIAQHFARLGADVVVNFFRNRAPAEKTVAEIRSLGRRAWLVKANIGEIAEIERLFGVIEKETVGLDFLVCNAASGYNRPVGAFRRPTGRAIDGKARRRRNRQYLQSWIEARSARLCGGRREQSSPGSRHSLPGNRTIPQKYRRQRRIARDGTDRSPGTLRCDPFR